MVESTPGEADAPAAAGGRGRVGEDWLLCLSLPSPTLPITGGFRPGRIILPPLRADSPSPSEISVKNRFRPEQPCKTPRWCIEYLCARIDGSRRERKAWV